ncbi:hypothetical protein PGIGA_G00106440 [Pangasianodon gigas]|uniref:Uncharacterized protein n=1 Tax=Pangasianodon gigas TaxID=30993 RepID=A0ACC5W8L6_PANGG|nr:hypothetical protein [Pangasianodon gigas]
MHIGGLYSSNYLTSNGTITQELIQAFHDKRGSMSEKLGLRTSTMEPSAAVYSHSTVPT